MLVPTLFWYGKLPTQPEFLSTNTDIHLQKLLQTWISTGQNHIGQSLVSNSLSNPLYGYGMLLQTSYYLPKVGILLTSHDSVGRSFPFIMLQDITIPAEQFFQQIQAFFIQQDIDFTQFYPSVEPAVFFSHLQQNLADLYALHSYHNQTKVDYWIEFYPNINHLRLTSDKLTPILYRKLMLRGNV